MITELLLRQTPADALVTMVNRENLTRFRPGDLIASNVRQVYEDRTLVRLTARRPSAPQDHTPPLPLEFDFEFRRLHVEGHLAGVLGGFRPSLPTSTRVLLDEITARTGQVFEPGEFIEHYIDRDNAGPYILTPSPDSLRWYGTMPIELATLPDLGEYLSDAVPAVFHTIPPVTGYGSSAAGLSQVNATEFVSLLSGFNEGDYLHDNPALIAFMRRAVPMPPNYSGSGAGWMISNEPGDYNLFGAVVVAKDAVNPYAGTNRNLNRAVHIRLDLAYTTNFTVEDFYIPYQSSYEPASEFAHMPRMFQRGILSASNGSSENVWLNTLEPGTIIRSVPNGQIELAGSAMWTASPSHPSPTNLYNAVVQHNGALRPSDTGAITPGLNRVLVVTINEPDNTAYTGNLSFYYRAPIVIDTVPDMGYVGVNYQFNLNPTEGVAPYTTELVGGTLHAGLTLSQNRITGVATAGGQRNLTIEVTDARDVRVRYAIRLNMAGG